MMRSWIRVKRRVIGWWSISVVPSDRRISSKYCIAGMVKKGFTEQ